MRKVVLALVATAGLAACGHWLIEETERTPDAIGFCYDSMSLSRADVRQRAAAHCATTGRQPQQSSAGLCGSFGSMQEVSYRCVAP